VSYSTTLGSTSFDAANPNGTPKLINAQVFAWPNIESDLHMVQLDLAYKWRTAWRFGVRYAYEKFELDDFTLDLVQPYVFGVTEGTRVDSRRTLLLDNSYGDYEINVASIYLGYTF